ncbi:MAG: LysE family translocator [Halofilum sp. (in: g-proteobacteria)]
MTFTAWLSVATLCVLGAVSPGPSLLVVVRHALKGRVQGIAAALAHAFGIGLYALVTVLGLSALVAAHPLVNQAITVAGAVYLAWLGLGALRGGDEVGRSAAVGTPVDWSGALRDGFTIALLNPKVAVFFLALFSQFVAPESSLRDTVVLALTAMSIDAAWYVVVAVALSGSAVAMVRRRQRMINRVTGVLLLGVSGWTLARMLGAS